MAFPLSGVPIITLVAALFWIIAAIHLLLAIRDRFKTTGQNPIAARIRFRLAAIFALVGIGLCVLKTFLRTL